MTWEQESEQRPLLGAAGTDSSDDQSMVSIAPIQNFTPPVNNDDGTITKACSICQSLIDLTHKADQPVVKCPTCNENTPIREPPPGKKYVRCSCRCLLICRSNSPKVQCPRDNCKRIIKLLPEGPGNGPRRGSTRGSGGGAARSANVSYNQQQAYGQALNLPGMVRIICAHCDDTFLFNATGNAITKCTHCRRVSSVGGSYKKKKSAAYAISSLVATVIAILVVMATSSGAGSGTYFTYFILFFIGVCLALRALHYYKMKVSYVMVSDSSPESI